MKISAKLGVAFGLAVVLLAVVGVTAIFFGHYLSGVLRQLHYYDFQAAQLAETQAAIGASPADAAAHLARLKDLESLARDESEGRLLHEAREELARRRGLAGVNRKLLELDTYYRQVTAAAHGRLVVLHRRAVLATAVAVLDATALLVVLMFLVRYWLLKPIARVGEAADKIVAGDLQHQIVASGQDEVDQLARDFNRLAVALREAQDQIQKTERLVALGEAGAFVAHNLRGPLAAIQTLASYERAAATVTPDARAAFDHIIVTARTLEHWVRNMLDSVRPFDLRLARQPIEPIIQNALSLLQRRLADNELEVQVQIVDDLTDVTLDASLVEQAMVSLLTNAVDASPAKGRIGIRASNGTGELTIAIEDAGSGMDPETLGKAFEPFFTTKSQGAGLGLTVARKIIQLHGGRLALESEPGRGTRVQISLPTAPTANHAG